MTDCSRFVGKTQNRRRAGGWRGLSSTAALLAAGWAVLAAVAGGCASTAKGPVTDTVVMGRELARSGIEALQRGQWEQAELLFSRAIEACPSDERIRARYAETLWQRGVTDRAIAHMEEAVRLSAGDPALLVRLGEMYLAMGQLDRAASSAQRAIARDGKLAAAWALRGDVLARQQQLLEALASYHRALSCQPRYPRVQLQVAHLYQQLGRPQRSLTTLEALAEQYQPGTEPQALLYMQGLALKRLGRYSEATETLIAAARRARPSADLLYELADAQLQVGDAANARLSLQAALRADPQHVASRQLLAQLAAPSPEMAVSLHSANVPVRPGDDRAGRP